MLLKAIKRNKNHNRTNGDENKISYDIGSKVFHRHLIITDK